jgi:hypothetical protein
LAGRAQAVPAPDRAATVTTQSGGCSSTSSAAPTAQSASQASTDEAPTDNGGKKNTHVRLGTVTVSAGYVHLPNNFFYLFFPGSFGYVPSFYDPFYWPSYALYGPSLAYAADKGKVELAVDQKNAEVYIDNAYAGQASRLKNIWLAPGAYNLAVTNAEGLVFQRRVYVLSGKSVKVKAKLVQQTTLARPEEKQP